MLKNVASQKLVVFAFDATTNLPKTGDAANLTAYVSKDFGTVTVLGDTSATEMDSANAKGYYLFDLTQSETNADILTFSAKSSTSNIVVVAVPAVVATFPTTGILAPATAGRTLVVDASGLADANTVKIGPTGSGTAQTAKDLGAINVTNLNTLSGHDPGATLGTSTLTQAQVTGGAYSIQSSSCVLGDARIANLDVAVSTRGTSTLTQTQVTGGAYSIQSSSCVLGDARIANLDAAVSTRLASASYSAAPSANSIADAVLTRDVSNVEGSAAEHSLCAVVLATTEWSISGTTWTIKKTDGVSTFATKTLTGTAGVDPITAVE